MEETIEKVLSNDHAPQILKEATSDTTSQTVAKKAVTAKSGSEESID